MNIGRPIEFDKAKVLDQAKQLFWRKGYSDTSLTDLLDVTGLSKSSFYQTFHSKHALFEQSIALYMTNHIAMMREMLNNSATGRGFIASMLYSVAENSQPNKQRIGCLVMNTACEFAQTDAVISKAVSKSIDDVAEVFKEAIILGQQQGNISTDKDPEVLARFLVTNMAGLNVSLKAGANADTLIKNADVALSAI